jgi:predicted thioesterase
VRIEAGMSADVDLVVGDADTAVAMRSGDVEVLATPRLIALCEEAAITAVAGGLEGDETTVGMRVQFDHLSPTPVGSRVRAEATLERMEGRRLTFTVSVSDGRGLVGAGKITRVVVLKERFMEKAAS